MLLQFLLDIAAMTRMVKLRILEIGIAVTILVLLIGFWYGIYYFGREPEEVTGIDLLKDRATAPVPFFILAVDSSASMEWEQNDPENLEREALKQVTRLIHYYGEEMKRWIGERPRLRVVAFSGSPVSITGKDDWLTLASPADVSSLDQSIDEALEKRTGLFTDFNSVIEYVLQAHQTKPRVFGRDKQPRQTPTVSLIFSDGDLDPNYLNRINHPDVGSWEGFLIGTRACAGSHLGPEAAEVVEQAARKEAWFDPADWASLGDCPEKTKRAFRSAYLQLNKDYARENPRTANHARTEAQRNLRSKIAALTFPPLSLNAIGLFSADQSAARDYLNRWADGLGYSPIISDSSVMGTAFTTILSDYLNCSIRTYELSRVLSLESFGPDVAAAVITVNFAEALPGETMDELVGLESPSGKEVKTSLNANLDRSKIFHITSGEFEDFHEPGGWRVTWRAPDGDRGEQTGPVRARVTLVTFHGFQLDVRRVEPAAEVPGRTRYAVRLMDVSNENPVMADQFDAPLAVLAENLGSDTGGTVEYSGYEEGVYVDFIDWRPDDYTVRFSLSGGRLKGEEHPLLPRSTTVKISVGPGIWAYTPDGRRIMSLNYPAMDRE